MEKSEMSYRHSLKPIFFGKRSSSNEKNSSKNYSRYRFLLLLLLTIYAGGSVLRLSLSSPPPPPSNFLKKPSSFVADQASKDLESNLKTHIPSDKNLLQSDHEQQTNPPLVPCSALIEGRARDGGGEGFLCCDRSHSRSDVCYMRGDIRLDSRSSSIRVYGVTAGGTPEKIRPYTRKFDNDITATINEITIHPISSLNRSQSLRRPACDVRHDGVPGLVFSAGGYTGNLYHEFSDGLIPLFVTAGRFGGEVVLVVVDYQSWWFGKYRRMLEKLSNYKLVNVAADRRIHCFSEMIVGLRIHGEMIIDPKLMPKGESIRDFQSLLHEGFGGVDRLESPQPPRRLSPVLRSSHHDSSHCGVRRPKIVILTRKFSRVLQNLRAVVQACRRLGFDVQIINPAKGFPLESVDDALQSADVMMAVHGAAMSHFLFMRPETSVLIQIVPLGLEWPAMEFYGNPALRLGLQYMAYNVTPEESSLYKEYGKGNEVLTNPYAITSKGWMEMKKIYLDKQNVTLSIKRFSKLLEEARSRICGLQGS